MESSVLSIILLVFLLVPTSAKLRIPLIIFGDSIYDPGNNNYINTLTFVQANFWPYGMTFFHYPTGRFSDGRLISDFIAEYASLPLIPPFLQPNNSLLYYDGANFASAAAGALVETNQGLVIDIHMQLENYKKMEEMWIQKFGDVKAKKKLASAVYLINFGANDYITLYITNSTFLNYTKSDYVNMVIGNITSTVTEIYRTGGRKFAFLNMPKLGCVPLLRMSTENGDCMTEPSKYAVIHNRALVHGLRELKKQLPGFMYSLYDWDTSFQQKMANPSKYGFKEEKAACCGSGKFRGEFSCGGTRLVKEYELCENHVLGFKSSHRESMAPNSRGDVESILIWNTQHQGALRFTLRKKSHLESDNISAIMWPMAAMSYGLIWCVNK